jgi:hypothetical protein
MTERLLGVLVFAALFVAFGLMTRRLGHRGCHDCGGSCGTMDHAGCDAKLEGVSEQGRAALSEPTEEKNPAGWWG